jgi:hypothetical protein
MILSKGCPVRLFLVTPVSTLLQLMSRRTFQFARWGIFLAACAFLYMELGAGQGTRAAWGDWRGTLGAAHWPVWIALLAMVVINWGIEAEKWRRLVASVEPMGFARAFSATLAGTATGLLTPNRTGEPVGRVLFLAPEHRWQGGFATVLGSIAQFTTTVVLGAVAFLVWRSSNPAGGGVLLAALITVVACAAVVLFFRPALLRRVLLHVPLLCRLDGASQVLERYPARQLLAVLLMSMARYAVFAAQYMMLLVVLAELSWADSAVAVPVIYLCSTLVPTMLLSELGVRGSVAVALLAPFGGQPALVLLASFGVWAVNIALPAAAGAVILLVARINTRK